MGAGRETLDELYPLVVGGAFDDLRERMLALWPPDTISNPDDVQLLTIVLGAVHREHGAAALPVYTAFAERLKTAGDRRWLQTLALRARIVDAYEALENAANWLRKLAEQTAPPDDGYVSLVLGRLFMAHGEPAAARPHLSRAVMQSLMGIEWYRLEALNDMALCLVSLGESRLAFEYVRTHSFEAYKLGRVGEGDLHRTLYGNALIFGQIDYLVDMKRNLARRARNNKDHTRAALHESDAGFRLAQLGLRDDAAEVLAQAVGDADQGGHVGDPAFAVMCRLLARYLALSPLDPRELVADLGTLHAQPSLLSARSIQATRRAVGAGAALSPGVVEKWQEASRRYRPELMRSNDEVRERLVLVHLTALLARYHAEGRSLAIAGRLFDTLADAPRMRDAIFLFVREDRAKQHVAAGQFRAGLELCRPTLEQADAVAHERFAFRQLAAQAYLGLGDDQQAYQYARLALGDWKRVLEGLYDEKRKMAWLQRGAALLTCAINALRRPSDWMAEPIRRHEIFRLMELGKARLVSDMVSHAGHVPGAYLLPDMQAHGRDFFDTLRRENPDWYAPVLLQSGSPADALATYVYDDDGRLVSVTFPDVTALRGVIQLPLSPEQRLYATADPLSFEDRQDAAESDLYADLVRALAPPTAS